MPGMPGPVDPLREMPKWTYNLCSEQMKHVGNIPRTTVLKCGF
jgi:hypothetical protein